MSALSLRLRVEARMLRMARGARKVFIEMKLIEEEMFKNLKGQ